MLIFREYFMEMTFKGPPSVRPYELRACSYWLIYLLTLRNRYALFILTCYLVGVPCDESLKQLTVM